MKKLSIFLLLNIMAFSSAHSKPVTIECVDYDTTFNNDQNLNPFVNQRNSMSSPKSFSLYNMNRSHSPAQGQKKGKLCFLTEVKITAHMVTNLGEEQAEFVIKRSDNGLVLSEFSEMYTRNLKCTYSITNSPEELKVNCNTTS